MSEHNLLPGFAPSEQDMIEMALAQPLDRKIERAIMLLKNWEPAALKLDPRGYWVADSFGKDSDCIVELAKMAGVAHHCEHNLTTIDPPELIRFGKRTRPETHINRPKMPLLQFMIERGKGPPSRLVRWCCSEYKEGAGKGTAKVIGVRIQESARRAAIWREFVQNKRYVGFILCPISYWTDKDVWAFHEERKIPHCELYDEGFTRLGCIGCPLCDHQERDFLRWPIYEKAWKKAVWKYWDKWKDIPRLDGKPRSFLKFGSPQGLWEWFMYHEGDGPACQGAELFAANELGDENANDE